ncbi:MAG: demethoxyubiquinone hydroxylase family protein [Alphaproteobacteria bacterium]
MKKTGRNGPKYLPGDRPARNDVASMIRVDHAGEYGAKRIYEGQIAILGKGPKGDILRHMAEQEARHLKAFEDLIAERRVRPTAFHPIWHAAGFAMGAGTALLGEKAAMACTVAVEEVIDEHYRAQHDALGDDEADLKAQIEEFRQEELEHRDIGLDHGAEQAPAYPVLTAAIKRASKLAIWLSERV